MSELREKIQKIVHDSVEEIHVNDNHGVLLHEGEATDQILAAFKAHIKGCEMPENSYSLYCNNAQHHAVELYRKALLESLE